MIGGTHVITTQPATQTNQQIPPLARNTAFSITSEHQMLERVLEVLDTTTIVDKLLDRQDKDPRGRRGYSKEALWRAYVTSFVFNLRYTNDLIRLLDGDATVRQMCGFEKMPHRTTFNRFINKLHDQADVLDEAVDDLVSQLHEKLPDLGKIVAADSTSVSSYSNPNKKTDPEASWGVKHVARGKEGKNTDWFYGFKGHMISDVTYGIPLTVMTTTAKRNDSPFLRKMFDQAKERFDWFAPGIVLGDRGYDSHKNVNFLVMQGIHPIIKMKDMRKEELYDGLYDQMGVPQCMGRKRMEYVGTDTDYRYVYRCPEGGCHLKTKYAGVQAHCIDDEYADPKQNPRLFGTIRRASDDWHNIYRLRYAVERPFKSMKQRRRLERHTVRGSKGIHAHVLMSALTFQATALANLKYRGKKYLTWMVPRVA